MSERVIPLVDQRFQALPAHLPHPPVLATGTLADRLARPLHDLRISVTDRCNFRCSYCMPKEVFNRDYPYLPQSELLTFEEITRLAHVFTRHGVRKLRITGGEPLLRKHLPVLVSQLAALRTLEGEPLDLTLTTNGSLLARQAQALREAGLQRVTISLDGLDDAVFRRMNDVDFPVSDVLEGIAAAQAAGLGQDAQGHWRHLKINMVVKRDTNLNQVVPMAQYFRGKGLSLRFIEYMDVGATNGWCLDEVVPSQELLAMLQAVHPLVALPPSAPGETAQRWGWADAHGRHDPALGEIGFISSVTQAFCHECNRARLSTEGKLYLCLFASQGYDLKTLLRQTTPPVTDAQLASAIGHIWQGREDRYSALRAQMPPASRTAGKRIEMSYIGG